MNSINQKKQDLDKAMPSSMILIYARARAYQKYISGLKGGKRSGISQMFGSAEDLFSDEFELPPTPKIDVAAIENGTQEENQWRALYLVDTLQKHADQLMREHIGRCRSGEFGSETSKSSKEKIQPEKVRTVVKEFCALYLYLAAIEQGVFDEGAPEWLQQFFGLSISILDMDIPGRSVEEIMSGFDYCDVAKLAQKLSSSIGRHLGFGSVGELAWNDFRKRVLCDGLLRFDFFDRTLKTSLPEIKAHLKPD